MADKPQEHEMDDPFNKDPVVEYGAPVHVAPGVRRITCPNPSAYTFTGTQSYLVGQGDLALIDPGPEGSAHLDAIMAALTPDEKITDIIVTHSHRDHSPGARVLSERTGAPVWAWGAHGAGITPTMQALIDTGAEIGGGEGGDFDFAPDRNLADGDSVLGGDWTLTALYTPGHMSNHISLELQGTGIVFTGDLVMGFATTLVSPPDGDMAAFMSSLERLSERTDDTLYLPGHGHAVEDPHGMLAYQRAHRQKRLEQILSALSSGAKDAATLTSEIYTDVDPALHGAAQRNVLASLIGLYDQGQVSADGPIAVDAVFARA
ncbi:MAG: MBL fold metallo-hydrolase [Pseudomonadota bacterium]